VQQFKVTSEPVVKKLAIVNYLSSHRMRATICKFYPSLAAANYNSKRTTVLNWVRNRGKLEVAVADGRGQHKKVHNKGVGATLFKELEADIVEWVNELRGDGIPVSTRMLMDKALDLAEEAELDNFMASDKWVLGFRGRHSFSFRCPTRQSRMCPDNLNKIASEFAAKVEATVNADQTGKTDLFIFTMLLLIVYVLAVFFECVAKRHCERGREKSMD